jgi:hypothetical protein
MYVCRYTLPADAQLVIPVMSGGILRPWLGGQSNQVFNATAAPRCFHHSISQDEPKSFHLQPYQTSNPYAPRHVLPCRIHRTGLGKAARKMTT